MIDGTFGWLILALQGLLTLLWRLTHLLLMRVLFVGWPRSYTMHKHLVSTDCGERKLAMSIHSLVLL